MTTRFNFSIKNNKFENTFDIKNSALETKTTNTTMERVVSNSETDNENSYQNPQKK
jgi:hypothetical protein